MQYKHTQILYTDFKQTNKIEGVNNKTNCILYMVNDFIFITICMQYFIWNIYMYTLMRMHTKF